MITSILLAAGADPTAVIGGDLPAIGGNARLGHGDLFVAEACEAYGSFLELAPAYAVVTNIEADHLDYYGDLTGILKAFRAFLERVTVAAIVRADDANIVSVTRQRTGLPRILNYGLRTNTDYGVETIAHENGLPSYDLLIHGRRAGTIRLGVPGEHNVANSIGAAAAALELGVDFSAVAAGLRDFAGTGRRFERLGETRSGVMVVDDYAHHPTEIRATLAAARASYPQRRLIAAFQPHLPSRTRDFMEQFAESFGLADQVVFTDIYLAREKPIEGVTGAGLAALTADRRGSGHVTYVADPAALPQRLHGLTHRGDLLLTLGAGDDIRKAAEEFLASEPVGLEAAA
jgi:UDP-N-acetylmuramate--alanine ligase